MKSRIRKSGLVMISLVYLIGLVAPVCAGEFSTAMNYVFLSNTYFASAFYYLSIAADYDLSGIDSTEVYNIGIQNLNSAVDNAFSAYSMANTGYNTAPTTINQYAKDTAYYDYYYKNQCRNWFYNDDTTDINWYIYLVLYWHGYAAYWTGLASNGGYN